MYVNSPIEMFQLIQLKTCVGFGVSELITKRRRGKYFSSDLFNFSLRHFSLNNNQSKHHTYTKGFDGHKINDYLYHSIRVTVDF